MYAATAPDRLPKQVQGFRRTVPVVRQSTAQQSTPHILYLRVGRTRNGMIRGHSDWIQAFFYNVEIRIAQPKSIALLALSMAAVGILAYLISVSIRIGKQSVHDETHPADVIIVMGAAEYSGKPSPVLRSRLDHALNLWKHSLAPFVMTTGGPGGDPIFTEGDVGRSYLMDRGVPPQAVIVEAEGETTMQSISAASEIMRRMGLSSCILVSDGYHIFRAKRMLQYRGIRVYGSPRQSIPVSKAREWALYFRQAVGFALWKIGVTV
jgi:uncharacterized SAM-binding protein YcdF (DUF218 family)